MSTSSPHIAPAELGPARNQLICRNNKTYLYIDLSVLFVTGPSSIPALACPCTRGSLWASIWCLWLTGWFAIKARLRSHAWACREVATPSTEQPASPEGRVLKRTSTVLHFLQRTWAICCEARLVAAHFRTRRDAIYWSRGSLRLELPSTNSYGYWFQSSPAPSRTCPAPASAILVQYAG